MACTTVSSMRNRLSPEPARAMPEGVARLSKNGGRFHARRHEAARAGAARWCALLACALALWASQTLALLHGVAHDERGHVHHGELFSHHDDDPSSCRLIDQLAHDAPLPAMPLPAMRLAVAPAPGVEPASQPIGAASEAALARAPPRRA